MITEPNQRVLDQEMATVAVVIEDRGAELLITAPDRPASPRVVRNALPPGASVSPGDTVVILPSTAGPLAIAVLAGQRALELADGSMARLDDRAHTLEVTRADGTLLFRYEADARQGRVVLGQEQTVIDAQDLRLRATGDLHLEANRIQAIASDGKNQTSLALSPGQARLRGDEVALTGGEIALDARETTVRSEALHGAVGRAVLAAQTLEVVADAVISTAKNVYQRVEELAQLRARSLRTIIDESIHVKAREILHRAADAYKVRADKIHLG